MDSPEERAHWRDVIRAFDGYMQYHLSANHARRMAFLALPRSTRDVFELVGYREKLDAVDEGIRRNAEFIDLMIQDPVFADMLEEHEGHGHGHDQDHGHGHDHVLDHGEIEHKHELDELSSHGEHPAEQSTPGHQPDQHAHDHDHGHSHNHSHSHSHTPAPNKPTQSTRDLQQDKVRSTLRSFVRDWAVEGAAEREACYTPILDALTKHYPDPQTRGQIKVLVPGCGLGRLAMEISARGFWSQGNEFSTYMLIASHFALNQTTTPEGYQIFPFLHSFSNHLTTENLLRSIRIPDVVPAEILAGVSPGAFSLIAGDFEEVYGPSHWRKEAQKPHNEEEGEEDNPNQYGRFGAVVTCFFIDTARNILTYLRIIHGLLAEGGVWINLGPLLWHFENAGNSPKGEGSVELSLDEVKELARLVGFEISQERMVKSAYTGVPGGMLEHVYNCAFWTATKIPQ